jgi:hypothetical protein
MVYLRQSEAEVPGPAPKKVKIGSGLFVQHPKGGAYLITAEHVSKDLSPASIATIEKDNDKPLEMTLAELSGQSKKLQWRAHSEADLVALQLSLGPEILPKLQGHFMPASMIQTDKSAPERDIVVTLLGFPLALGTKGSFSPISYDTSPASGLLVLERADTKKPTTFFVSQDPGVGGFSGAPVFDMKKNVSPAGGGLHIRSRGYGPRDDLRRDGREIRRDRARVLPRRAVGVA